MKRLSLRFSVPILLLLSACRSIPENQENPLNPRPIPTKEEVAAINQTLVDDKCRRSNSRREYEACLIVATQQMPAIDRAKREYFGERYDPKTWYTCMQEGGDHGYFKNDNCDVYQLRRLDDNIAKPKIDMPEIKWPRSTELPAPSRGMSKREYFDFLCKSEAGETIYKTVENVPGLLQMRPAFEPTDLEYSDRYVLEDPYSITRESLSAPWDAYVQPLTGKYDFLEMSGTALKKNYFVKNVNEKIDFTKLSDSFVRFYRDVKAHPGKTETSYLESGPVHLPSIVNAVETNKIQAKFGYTWRGLGGASLRESGITGGDQVVVDLRTGEVLALRRSFVFSDLRSGSSSVLWMGAAHCTNALTTPTHIFVKKVLKPIHPFGSIN
nr:hypothetical protein [uncultured Undibacterium sp.]